MGYCIVLLSNTGYSVVLGCNGGHWLVLRVQDGSGGYSVVTEGALENYWVLGLLGHTVGFMGVLWGPEE